MSLKSLAKQTAIYGISTIVLRLAGWWLAPYYSYAIEPVAIGMNSELLALVAFFNVIYMMGMETSYFRFLKTYSEEETFQKAESVVFYNALFWSLLLAILATPIVKILHYEGKEIYIYLLSVILFMENLCNIPFARLRQQNKAMQFVGLKAVYMLINIALNIFFLSFIYPKKIVLPFSITNDPVELIFWANFIPWVLLFIYFSRSIFSINSINNIFKQKDFFQYSFPLIIVGMAGMVNETLDRVMLKYILPGSIQENLAEVGIYSTNYKLAIIMTLVIQGFRMGAEPYFFQQADKKDAPKTYALIMEYFVIFCSIIFVLASINRELIAHIMESKYLVGVKILPPLLLANLFLGMYYNSSVWYKLTDNTKKGAWISVIGAAITFLVNFILIPKIGYMGSAIATLICYFSMLLISLYWGQKVYPIPYRFSYLSIWIVGSVIYSTLVFHLLNDNVLGLMLSSILYFVIVAYIVWKQLIRIYRK